MSGWSTRLCGERGGAAAVEFALAMPFLLALLVGVTEIARYLSHGEAVEKGLRAGASYAARQNLDNNGDLPGPVVTETRNLVKTGTRDGSGAFLVPGWSDGTAKVDIVLYKDSTAQKPDIDVIRIDASVPYQELAPGFLGLIGLGSLTIEMQHEQVHFGN